MTKIIITFLIALSCLCAVSCGDSASQVPHHVFLLQLVHTAQIVKTPDLKQYRSIPRLRKIIDNRSIDGGLPASPIIKKLKILDDTRNCLFAPADSIYDFPLTAAKHARLRFGFAMTDEYLKHRRVPTAFKIWIKENGEQSFRLLFHEHLFPGSTAMQGWHDRTIELKNKETAFTLRFQTLKAVSHTQMGDDLFAYWSNPFVINPQKNTRSPGNKKKLILISLDTLRADHLNTYGYSRKTMPELQHLSEDFITFKNCWSQWCWTRESHQSIMTGLYEVEHQVPELYPTTPEHLVTLAEVMKSQGYVTAAFTGSGHVGAHTGLCKGFDSYFDNEYRRRGGFELLGTWFRAKKWLTQNAAADFFLFFHTYEIHAPYSTLIPFYDRMFQAAGRKKIGHQDPIFDVKEQPQGAGLDRIDWLRNTDGSIVTSKDHEIIQGYKDYYDGSIRYTNDLFIKNLIVHLKALGIYDDTVIVILSDHGEEFFEHGRFKHFDGLYEEYIHVPLLFKLADSRYGGQVIPRNTETIDVFPTLLELMDIPLKHKIDGRSLVKWMDRKNRLKSQEHLVFSQSSAKFAVKQGHIKLLIRARIDEQTRDTFPRLEVFDLKTDPHEQHPVKTDDLSQHLQLYTALYNRIIRKERGIHLLFSRALEGKVVEGQIDIPAGGSELKNIFEIGAVRSDMTLIRSKKKQIIFKWKISKWNKSLILIPRKGKLDIRLQLNIDGTPYNPDHIVLDQSVSRKGDRFSLTWKSYKPGVHMSNARVAVFGNGTSRKSKNNSYLPEISKENIEKLKELGYINN